LTSLEERVEMTFNMGAKINGLHHAGVGDNLYGGRRLADVVAANGAGQLDTPTWGPPIVTRGLLVDVVARKIAEGDQSALSATPEGRPILTEHYRITLADIAGAIAQQNLPSFRAGDAIFLRTGWGGLIETDPDRFLAASPGVWLRECRWLATFRPALTGTDSWMWGTSDPEVTGRAKAACHQEMLTHFGIRLGEGMHLDEIAEAGVDRFVFCHNPLRAEGAVSSNAPALAIANVAPTEP
jgi:kynurenine formamidase